MNLIELYKKSDATKLKHSINMILLISLKSTLQNDFDGLTPMEFLHSKSLSRIQNNNF